MSRSRIGATLRTSLAKCLGALVLVASLGGTVVAAAPANAMPERVGAHPCALAGDGTTYYMPDGTEIDVTFPLPSGKVGTAHYRCDNGKWVKTAAILTLPWLRSVNGQITATVHMPSGSVTKLTRAAATAVVARATTHM